MPSDRNWTHRRRATQWNAKGEARTEYWIEDGEGFIKPVSPMQFHKSVLPDTTAPDKMETFAAREYAKRAQLNRRVEDHSEYRRAAPAESFAVWACKKRGYAF
jgi:hypothetical protein